MSGGAVNAIIRPAAILPETAARRIVSALEDGDVAKGGVWNASSSIWQRYDKPWDGEGGSRGTSVLVGTIAVVYNQPRQYEITIYKVSIATEGVAMGWTTESLCDDALKYADLTLATCPRADLKPPPAPDPFHIKNDDPRKSIWASDVGELLRSDVKDIFGRKGE